MRKSLCLAITIMLILPTNIQGPHIRGPTRRFEGWIRRNTDFVLKERRIRVITFVTPDSSYEALKMIFGMANESIDIMTYEMWSEEILDLIKNTASRGIAIRVLLEGDPYGTAGDNWNLNMSAKLYKLKSDGLPIEIRLENDSSRYLHAKVIIVDNSTVLITSENFMPTAFPLDPANITLQPYSTVSRGWGVIVFDKTLALECREIFDEIFVNESVSYDPSMGSGEEPWMQGYMEFSPVFGLKEAYVEDAKLVWSPNNSLESLKSLLNSTTELVLIEQMYIKENDTGVSDLIKILDQKVSNGATVQMIVEDNYPGNYYDIKQSFEQRGFHLAPAFYYESRMFLHNKGIIVDDKCVLVGSINWSGSALLENTEVGVLVNSTEIALYFKNVFEWDWDRSSSEPFDSDGDGLPNCYEYDHNLNPNSGDSDGDGLNDYEEVFKYNTDPAVSDTVEISILEPQNGSFIPRRTVALRWSLTNQQHVSRVEVYVNSTKITEVSPTTTEVSIELEDQALSVIELRPVAAIPVKVYSSKIMIYVDSKPPTIEIVAPQNNTNLTDNTTSLKLIVRDNTSVTLTIYVNDTKIYEASVPCDELIQLNISLSCGLNKIRIVVRDSAGNEAASTLYIYVATSSSTTGGPSLATDLTRILPGLVIILSLLIVATIIIWKKKSQQIFIFSITEFILC